MHKTVVGGVLLFLVSLSAVARGQADNVITPTAEFMNRQTFIGAASRNLREGDQLGDAWAIIDLAKTHMNNRPGSYDYNISWNQRINDSRNKLNSAMLAIRNVDDADPTANYEAGKLIYDILMGAGGAAADATPWTKIGFGAAKPVADQIAQQFEADSRRASQVGSIRMASDAQQLVAVQLNEALAYLWDAGEKDPTFKTHLNTILPGLVKVKVGNSREQTLQDNPDFANSEINLDILAQIKALADANGQNLKKEDFEKILKSEFEKLQVQGEAQRAILQKLVDQGTAAADAEAAQRLAALKTTKFELKMQSSQAGFFILSQLVGASNPVLGKRIAAVGDAGIQLVSAVDKLRDNLKFAEGLTSGGENYKRMAGTIFSGNLVSIGLQLFSIFGSSGPTPEQIILDQIGALRDQLTGVQAQLNDRLDIVDQRLIALTKFSQAAFQHLFEGQIRIEEDLRILNRLTNRNEQYLVATRDDLRNYFLDLQNRDIEILRRTTVEVRRTTPQFVLPEPAFNDASVIFHNDAVSFSLGRAAMPIPDRALFVDEITLGNRLNELPSEGRMVIVGAVLGNRLGLPDLAAIDRLPSPAILNRGATCYMSLGDAWPALRRKRTGSTEEVDHMLQRAQDIELFCNAITRTPVGEARPDVFKYGFDFYERQMIEAGTELRRRVEAYLKDTGLQGYDLWDTSFPKVPSRLLDPPKFLERKSGRKYFDDPETWNAFDDPHPGQEWRNERITVEPGAPLPTIIAEDIPRLYLMASHLQMGTLGFELVSISRGDPKVTKKQWYKGKDNGKQAGNPISGPDKPPPPPGQSDFGERVQRRWFRLEEHSAAQLIITVDVTFKPGTDLGGGEAYPIYRRSYKTNTYFPYLVSYYPCWWDSNADALVTHFTHVRELEPLGDGRRATFSQLIKGVDPEDFKGEGDRESGLSRFVLGRGNVRFVKAEDEAKVKDAVLKQYATRRELFGKLAASEILNPSQSNHLKPALDGLNSAHLLLCTFADLGLQKTATFEPEYATIFYGADGLVGNQAYAKLLASGLNPDQIDAKCKLKLEEARKLMDGYFTRSPLPREGLFMIDDLKRRLWNYRSELGPAAPTTAPANE